LLKGKYNFACVNYVKWSEICNRAQSDGRLAPYARPCRRWN